MTKYRIEVTEILCRIIETEAESEKDAVEMVRRMYRSSDFVLDAFDYIKTEISVARREEIENIKTFATYKRKIPDIVKAEDTQTDYVVCHEDIVEKLPFLDDMPITKNEDVLIDSNNKNIAVH